MTPEIFDIIARYHKSSVMATVVKIGERFGLDNNGSMHLYNEYLSMTKAGNK